MGDGEYLNFYRAAKDARYQSKNHDLVEVR